MAETFICSIYGREHPMEDCTEFDGSRLCPTCLRERTCICDYCGERVWLEDAHTDDRISVCNDCFDGYYETCADCGRIALYGELNYVHEGDSEGYCDNCYNRHRGEASCGGVESYYISPPPSSTAPARVSWAWSWRSTMPGNPTPTASCPSAIRNATTSTSSMTAPAWAQMPDSRMTPLPASSASWSYGYDLAAIDRMLAHGLQAEEIEEYLYEGEAGLCGY